MKMAKYKLVCFDVDGTLVDNLEYSWELFHTYFKVDDARRKSARDAYFSGKISYLKWAEHDINLWKEKNARREQFIDAIEKSGIKLMEGAESVIYELKKRGLKIAIISGSISIILEHLFPDFDSVFDDVYITRLFFDEDGILSGAKPTFYDMEHKATALKEIAEREKLFLDECVFVGDHHNDVKIAQEAGLSIAFNCKSDELRKVAKIEIVEKDLRKILDFVTKE